MCFPRAQDLRLYESENAYEQVEESIPTKIQFNQLTIGKLIGRGAYGRVYFGEYANQTVAIKKINFSVDTKQAVKNEINLLYAFQTFNIPHVVKFFGFEQSKAGQVRIIMEYMYSDLETFIGSKLTVTWATNRKMMLAITKAVATLHDFNIILCDIKPKNILLTEDGKAKLGDFGSAKNEIDATPNAVAGTVKYMDPEVLCNITAKNSKQSDIYSLSLTFFALLKRTRNPDKYFFKELGTNVCPAAVFEVIQKGLGKKSNERPTAKELYSTIKKSRKLV